VAQLGQAGVPHRFKRSGPVSHQFNLPHRLMQQEVKAANYHGPGVARSLRELRRPRVIDDI
jgi:hypothetical protein